MRPDLKMAEVEESSDEGQGFTLKDSPRIVIIGAGIAGIAAGNYLANAGFQDFVILEATERVGGRIWSIDLETANGRKAELGANWIHGIDANPIYKIATQHNLLSKLYQGRKLGQKMMFLTETGEPVNTKVVEEVDWTYGMIMSRCEEFYQMHEPTPLENDSVGAFIMREFEEKLDRYHGNERHIREMVLQQRLLGECIISGSNSMHDISLSEVGSFQELPGVHYVIPPGFESVCHILQEDLPSDAVRLNHAVSQIKWGGQGGEGTGGAQGDDKQSHYPICVECQNGAKFNADHVIVTISLGYLKQHSGRLFSPPLPDDKMTAIQRVSMGTVNKVILEFGGQVLPDGIFRLELIWDRDNVASEDISECWFKKIGSFEAVADNVLMGWLSGREAEYMEGLDEEDVGRQCVKFLSKFLGNTGRELPPLKKVMRSQWKSNPYTLGAYSFIPVGAYAEDIDTLGEPLTDHHTKPLVLFAGEATHTTFYSSSHGALLSGQREAERLLQLYHHSGEEEDHH